MLDFDFSEKDKQKYYRKAQQRLDAAGIGYLKPDPSAIGARGWSCTTNKANVVIVHLMPYPKDKWSRKKAAECRKVEGWCNRTGKQQASGWRGHTMAPEVPDYMIHSCIEFVDGRGRHGTKG